MVYITHAHAPLTHAHPHTHTGLLVSYHYYGPGRGSWTAWTHPAPSGVTERSPPGGEAPQGGGGKHRGTRVVLVGAVIKDEQWYC